MYKRQRISDYTAFFLQEVAGEPATLIEYGQTDAIFTSPVEMCIRDSAYSSLNLGSHVGDDPFAVQENRRRALEAMGAAECKHNLLIPNQVHGDHIVAVVSNLSLIHI